MRFCVLFAQPNLKYMEHADGNSRLSMERNTTVCVLWNVQMRIAERLIGNYLQESFHTSGWMQRKSVRLQQLRLRSIQRKPIPAPGQAYGHGWPGFLNTPRIFWLNLNPAMIHPGKAFQSSWFSASGLSPTAKSGYSIV